MAVAAACDSGPVEPKSDIATIRLTSESFTTVVGGSVPVLPITLEAAEAEPLRFRPFIVAFSLDAAGGLVVEPFDGVSSDPEVAAVEPLEDGGAIVRGLKPGTTTIRFEAGLGSAELAVTVEAAYSLDLLDEADATKSAAYAINAAGHVVGYVQRPDDIARAVVWRDGSTVVLPRREGADPTFYDVAMAINDAGLIGGRSSAHAVLWEGNTVQDLKTPEHPLLSVNDINEAGDLVGYSSFGGLGGKRGWARISGEFVELPLYDALAINERGQIAGIRASSRTFQDAVRWWNGAVTVLAACSGTGLFCRAVDLNDAGRIVGSVGTARLWAGADDQSLELGVSQETWYPGSAVAINNRDEVLILQGRPGSRLALWRAGRLANVNALHTNVEWLLTEVADINDAGQIVGTARHILSGAEKAAVLSPRTAGAAHAG